jgi:DNA-3-methyladenine glycosylase II
MPATDYGVRKGFQILYRKRALPTPKQIVKLSEKWRPYRSVAALYLWRIADTAKTKKSLPK